MSKLVIISHTEHYISEAGVVKGWGPTIREINYLSQHFDEIVHVAPLYSEAPPASSMAYQCDNIRFEALKPAGGTRFLDKLGVLKAAYHNLKIMRAQLSTASAFQFRAPTGMGVYMIPYLSWFSNKKGWFKYAGNWKEPHPPLSYRFQRWFLERCQKRKVTINGSWAHQANHCTSFENPCLTADERLAGENAIAVKNYDNVINFCFIGRLLDSKGVGRIIEAFNKLKSHHRLGQIHMIGDGEKRAQYEEQTEALKEHFVFHGFMPRDEIGNVLKDCHVFLLPSDSEGFPKVVAEAANYGCIPVVSNVSCLDQYITPNVNGHLLPYDDQLASHLLTTIEQLLSEDADGLKSKAHNAYEMAKTFSFEYYSERILKEVLEIR